MFFVTSAIILTISCWKTKIIHISDLIISSVPEVEPFPGPIYRDAHTVPAHPEYSPGND